MNHTARKVCIGLPHHRCTLLLVGRPIALFRTCSASNTLHGVGLHATRHRLASRGRRPTIKAVVSQAAELKSTTERPARIQQFPLSPTGSNKITVKVEDLPERGNRRVVTIWTDAPGKFLLHWGVEGGPGYKGGWRLPGSIARPPGTIEYKKRALQTPFVNLRVDGETSRSGIVLDFPPSEECDALVFVVKDISTDRWFDFHGANFRMDLSSADGQSPQSPQSPQVSVPDQLPLDAIPPIPSDLAGVWSYMKWEAAGYPTRTPEEADQEYHTAIKELTTLLRNRIELAELQDVAAQGVQRYVAFMDQQSASQPPPPSSQPPPPSSQPLPPSPPPSSPPPPQSMIVSESSDDLNDVPDSLLALKAYLMWEAAGKPDGADFGEQARQELTSAIRNGATVQELEAQMRQGPSASTQVEEKSPPPPPPSPPPQSPIVVMKERNPLDLIHRSTAPMLAESGPERMNRSKKTRQKPLSPLVQAARRDEACLWHRLYPLGSKSELLVTVCRQAPCRSADAEQQPQQSVQVTLTTDASAELVLHWGIQWKGKSSWQPPPPSILPPNSTPSNTEEGVPAAESAFAACDEEECLVEVGGAAVPLKRVTISIDGQGLADLMANSSAECALSFVIRSDDGTRWWKDGGGDFVVPLFLRTSAELSAGGPGELDALSSIIVDCEVKSGAWTLMHRFSKAAELIDDIVSGRFDEDPGIEQAMLSIFVWLRYSSIRQLTWQRNYNTQPRILGAAQQRLTTALASATAAPAVGPSLTPAARSWARMSLTTVGRGGNAQAVRDEILNIMHANKLPELKGTWMEEWHQKLHNNTTPDDVGICKAYLAFLRSDGDLNAYWETLSEAGITRQRLESFDRPITTQPEFFPEKKDALVADMSKYLATLKSTHSGADLQASAAAAAPWIPRTARGYLGHVLASQGTTTEAGHWHHVAPLIIAAVEARTELAPLLSPSVEDTVCDHDGDDSKALRELLYLDIALENVVRAAAESGARMLPVDGPGGAADLLSPLLQNLALSMADNEEVCYCLKAWREVFSSSSSSAMWDQDAALKAMATLDRIKRALATASDATYRAVAPVASSLGTKLGCEPWAVQLFPDEVVRGGPAFAVSLVLSTVEPWFRSIASLGAWQLISPVSEVRGRLVRVPSLSVEDDVYGDGDENGILDYDNTKKLILLADRVGGEEEVPPGTVGVLSCDAPDVLSHLAVRARNLKVLFAACHDRDTLDELAREVGNYISIKTTAAGDVSWQVLMEDEGGLGSGSGGSSTESSSTDFSSAEYSSTESSSGAKKHPQKVNNFIMNGGNKPGASTVPWVVGMDAFENGVVGGKSRNLAILSTLLPSGVRLPPSVTVPFGVMESVLEWPENSEITDALTAALRSMSHHKEKRRKTLERCRALVMDLVIPPPAKTAIEDAVVKANICAGGAGGAGGESWWEALKTVWASKYNERAAISARHHGIDFTAVNMAVLIQRIIPARYAFVIHTTNPTNGNENEIYCEIVCGLGEAIVSGNVPGTALACTCRKDDLDSPPTVLFYPSKSQGMFVPDVDNGESVLIFRSDSNGEDLEGYAGAGLYDSVLTRASVLRTVDYAADPLVANTDFRDGLLTRICKLGAEIEKAFGSPQDVEGVVDDELNITIVQTRPQV